MMDDVIYRQEAIEVADAVWMVTGDNNVAKVWAQLKDVPSAQQWIPCSERLPEIGQTVITSSDLGRVREATYKGFDAWTIHGVVHWTDEILSWMPLPEPYKEDE